LWNEVLEIVWYKDADTDHLTYLTIFIMELAEVTGELENSTWLKRHRTVLGYQSRESWDGEMTAASLS